MNECEQIHPLLRGYLEDKLSARDRRMVARHLNLCTLARKELDRLRSGGPKTPAVSAAPPSEPWDLKILRWLFKTPRPSPQKEADAQAKKNRPAKQAVPPGSEPKKSSAWKFIMAVLLFFVALAFLTHFVQNAGENSLVKDVKRWLSRNHILGVSSSLDLVLDLTDQPHWSGNAAPVAFPYNELVSDPARFRVYWMLLQPGVEQPDVDFTKNTVAVLFMGQKTTAGYTDRFKRMESYTDKTVLWYDEGTPLGGEAASAMVTRPWVLQVVPKPTQDPVLIQKIQ